MKKEKQMLLEAYSYLYEIETNARTIVLAKLPDMATKDITYRQLTTMLLDYDFLHFSATEKQNLSRTTSIRNKTCHMRPLKKQELYTLKQAHSLLE